MGIQNFEQRILRHQILSASSSDIEQIPVTNRIGARPYLVIPTFGSASSSRPRKDVRYFLLPRKLFWLNVNDPVTSTRLHHKVRRVAPQNHPVGTPHPQRLCRYPQNRLVKVGFLQPPRFKQTLVHQMSPGRTRPKQPRIVPLP